MILTPLNTTGTIRQLGRAYSAPGAPFDSAVLGMVTDVRPAEGDEVTAYGDGSWVEVVRLGYYEHVIGPLASFRLTDTFLTFRAPTCVLDTHASLHCLIGVEQ